MEEKIKQLIQQYNKGGFTQSELEWEFLNLYAVSNSKRESLENFSELLKKIIEKTKASDNGLIYCDAGDIMQDVCDNYTIIKK